MIAVPTWYALSPNVRTAVGFESPFLGSRLKPYFFDRCLGVRLVGALAGYRPDVPVEHQDRCAALPCDISDVDLLRFLSSRDPPPIFVTADRNMNLRAGPSVWEWRPAGSLWCSSRKGSMLRSSRFSIKMIAAWDILWSKHNAAANPLRLTWGPEEDQDSWPTCNL